MESAVVSQDQILNANDIDFDSILQDFNFDLDTDFDLLFPDPQLEDSDSPKELDKSESLSSFADEIEKFLMEDSDECLVENGDKRVDELVSELIVDVSGSGSGSDSGNTGAASPESVESEGVEDRDEEDDQTRKKRRRQMRNRESAMQSRERKKIYVKELEMKSKYLESECRRLDYALRCCRAENLALHQRLQKGGALAAKQESAVLFVESLLLGSLFWLVSIVFLFLAPSLQIPNPEGEGRRGRGLALEVAGSKTPASKRSHTDLGFDGVILGRRWRGLRTRMKSILFPLHAMNACDYVFGLLIISV